MTVKELISLLETFNQESEMFVATYDDRTHHRKVWSIEACDIGVEECGVVVDTV